MPSPLVRANSNFLQRNVSLNALDTIRAGPVAVKTALPFDVLGVFVRQYETGDAIPRIPVFAFAEVSVVDGLPPGEDPRPTVRYPLGLLGTDHVGYASFDLTVLRRTTVVDHLGELLAESGLLPATGGPQVTVGLTGLFVFPFADPLIRIDALTEGDIGPTSIALRIELDEADLAGRVYDRPMTAMQNPSIDDWRLSPSSFSMAGAVLVGEGGCETFLPANLSTQQFRFHQVARSTEPPRENDAATIRLGHLFEYRTEWFAVGHSLGQVQYSLPLAPGEKVNIAIVDWSRQDRATRTEETDFRETLVHDWTRDRTISETVHSVLNEWQRGGSVMGGVAASGSSGALGGSAAIGGGYTTSSGTRELTADTTQRIADAFHQASTAMRELRSTVVVQSSQAEKANVQTRVVANYNHSHAMTILYYEVLRHYRVVTRLVQHRPVIFVDYAKHFTNFAPGTLQDGRTLEQFILDNRATLESALLDERVRGCFDAVQTLECRRANFKNPPTFDPTDDLGIGEIILVTNSGASVPARWVRVRLHLKDGDPVNCVFQNMFPPQYAKLDQMASWWLSEPLEPRVRANELDFFRLRPERHVRWGNVAAFEFEELGQVQGATTSAAGKDWDLQHVRFWTTHGETFWDMFNAAPPAPQLKPDTKMRFPVTRYAPKPHTAEDMLTDEERCCVAKLRAHLASNANHYNRALWLAEDAGVRSKRLESVPFTTDWTLLDVIENTAVDAIGDWVAFPINVSLQRDVLREMRIERFNIDFRDDFVEQLLTLPTRGVFAEAKLGHCNASEIIDTTRFWDWQTSPIPDNAPQITGVDAGSRAQAPQGLTPSPFPSGLVNIVNPPNAPDPTGMSSAMSLFAAMGGFRDMSAAKEVGALLQTLSNNATGLAALGRKAQETKGLIDQIRGAKEIPPERRADLIGEVLTGQVHAQSQTQAQAQAQAQKQDQGQAQAQAQNQQQSGSQAQQQSGTQGQQQGQDQKQEQKQESSQTQVQVQPKPQVPKPGKPPRTERPTPGKVRIIAVFQAFQEVGGIRTVWGTLAGNDGAADGIPNGPPFAGQKNYLCNHITGKGTVQLFVQLETADSITLDDSTPFTPDENNTVTIKVKPKTAEIEVEERLEIDAKLKAEYTFKTQFGGEMPIRMIKAKVEETLGGTLGGEIGGAAETKKKFKYIVLRKGLDFS